MAKIEAIVKILDEVNCVISNLKSEHTDYFHHKYGKHAPNYFFHPKYKLGSWDGKIRYFSATGKTHVNLLGDIIPMLVKMGYKIRLVDLRKSEYIEAAPITKDFFSHILNPETGEPIELRPYQVEAVNAVIKAGGGLVIAGTGAGKTICNAALVESYGILGQRTITIVPSSDLVTQTKDDFSIWQLDVGEYSGDVKDIDHTHVVSTWQALQNNPKIMSNFDVVVVDECHGTKGNVLTKLLNDYGSHISLRFGLTGTLPKAETDAMAVRIALGDVKYEIPAHELISQGWLAKLHIDIRQLEVNLRTEYDQYCESQPNHKMTYIKFKEAYFPEYTTEKSFLQTNTARLEWISKELQLKQENGNVFCLVDGIRFGKKLTKLIPGAIFVHGSDKKKARKQVYDLFKDNDNLVVIATVHIASTGLNIKRIFNLCLIDAGKSFIRVIQTIGRGLRKAPDKDHVLVTDICSDLKYGKKHMKERMNYYDEAKYPYDKKTIKL